MRLEFAVSEIFFGVRVDLLGLETIVFHSKTGELFRIETQYNCGFAHRNAISHSVKCDFPIRVLKETVIVENVVTTEPYCSRCIAVKFANLRDPRLVTVTNPEAIKEYHRCARFELVDQTFTHKRVYNWNLEHPYRFNLIDQITFVLS